MIGEILNFLSGFANTPSAPSTAVAVGRNIGRGNNQSNSSSTQANIGSSDSSNDQSQPNSSTNSSKKSNRIIKKGNKSSDTSDSSTRLQAASSTARGLTKENSSINQRSRHKKLPSNTKKGNVDATEPVNENESDSDTDSDVDIKTRDGEKVQEADKNRKWSTNKTPPKKQNHYDELVVFKPKEKPMPAKAKHSWPSKTSSNALTSKHVNEDPYKSAPDIKNAVMIYDTIDEAIKKKGNYPYTKSFVQTNKTWKNRIFEANEKMKKYIESYEKKSEEKRAARLEAKDKSKQEKDKLQQSKDDAEKEANKLVDELLEKDFNDIKADHPKIIELHIKIQDVEGGAKAYITKLENEAMNMKGGKRGKRTRRKRQPVQKGGKNNDMEKKKIKLKIVDILKKLNSANYIDYEIESIIQELKKLLGQPSTVDSSIPKIIKTETTIQEDMYSEPLPICTDKDKNSNTTCKKNREKLENRLKYFNKLKELNAMHNDNELLAVAQSVINDNKEYIEAYYKPYAKSDDTTNDKTKKNENYLKTLINFKKIENEATNRKIKKYNEIVDYLNYDKNKENIVNPQLDEKLMTTNIKQTKTGDTIFSNILSIEHLIRMINNFENNPTLLKAMNSTVDGKGDPGHTNIIKKTEVKSTDILRNNEPENNVEAK